MWGAAHTHPARPDSSAPQTHRLTASASLTSMQAPAFQTARARLAADVRTGRSTSNFNARELSSGPMFPQGRGAMGQPHRAGLYRPPGPSKGAQGDLAPPQGMLACSEPPGEDCSIQLGVSCIQSPGPRFSIRFWASQLAGHADAMVDMHTFLFPASCCRCICISLFPCSDWVTHPFAHSFFCCTGRNVQGLQVARARRALCRPLSKRPWLAQRSRTMPAASHPRRLSYWQVCNPKALVWGLCQIFIQLHEGLLCV